MENRKALVHRTYENSEFHSYSAVFHCDFEMISLNNLTAWVVITNEPSTFLEFINNSLINNDVNFNLNYEITFSIYKIDITYPNLISCIKSATTSSGKIADFVIFPSFFRYYSE